MKRPIDPELKYCPRCDDEYRAEIVRCAACSVDLVSGRELLEVQQRKTERSQTIGPHEELVGIRKGSVMEMKQLQAMLRREGFPSLAVNEDGGCGQGCCGPSLVVQVRRADLQDVAACLERDYVRSTGLDKHDVSTAGAVFDASAESAVCPACGHRFSTAEHACPDCGLCFA